MFLSEITLAAFSIFNILRLASNLPQIVRVASDTDGARAISYSTWSIWIGANGSTAAYAIVNISDWALFVVSLVNALGCAAVVGLTTWKRRRIAHLRIA
jgi:hypothetical protein